MQGTQMSHTWSLKESMRMNEWMVYTNSMLLLHVILSCFTIRKRKSLLGRLECREQQGAVLGPEGPWTTHSSSESSQLLRSFRGWSLGVSTSQRGLCVISARSCLNICFESCPNHHSSLTLAPASCSLTFRQTPKIAIGREREEQQKLNFSSLPFRPLKKKWSGERFLGFAPGTAPTWNNYFELGC